MANIIATTYENELSFIARCVLDYPDIETGGDYFGFWDKNGMPVIQFVTGPGKNTTRSSTSFYQDIDYLHECGNYLYFNHGLEHIGSWHSHHKLGLQIPSSGDVNTMVNALVNIDKFFITICNIIDKSDVKINAFLFSRQFPNHYEAAKWACLPEDSPIKILESRNKIFIYPKTKRANFIIDKIPVGANTLIIPEKADLPKDSYFETKEGRSFLKAEFEKIKNQDGCSDVELVQNDDKTIGILFNYFGKSIEVRYPNDFSDKNPNPILIEKENNDEIKRHNFKQEQSGYIFKPLNMFFEEIHRMIFGFVMKKK